MLFKGRKIYQGEAQGEALATSMGISFFGGVDPETGVVVEKGHQLQGQSISGKVLVFPFSIGSLAGGVSLLEAIVQGVGPKAIVNNNTDGVLLAAPVFARVFYDIEVPVVDSLDQDPSSVIKNGDFLVVDGNRGLVEVTRKG